MAELNDPILGGRLDTSVTKQLEVRKNKLTKTVNRSLDDLMYLNSNTGWVKLTSSVNTEVVTPENQGKKQYSNILAKNTVMFSGTSTDTTIKGGLTGENSSYSMSNTLGIRPMAGITDVSITSQNTFGTLRVASIRLIVNSIEQLDTIEALFMRPGFSALLEWGHTLYLDNKDSKVEKNIETVEDFFIDSNRSEIEKTIKTKKSTSSNNYDAMYGVIKNFVWSMNPSGGYDCSVDLVSIGEILESIKVDISPGTIFKKDPFKEGDTSSKNSKNDEYSLEQKKTPLHTYLNIIKYAGTSKYYKEPGNIDLTREKSSTALRDLQKYIPDFFKPIRRQILDSGGNFNIPAIHLEGAVLEDFGPWSSYITVGHLLAVINQSFLLKDSSGLLFKFFTGDKDTLKTPFLTFPGHIAIDPQIAVLPKPYLSKIDTKNGGIVFNSKKETWDDLLRYNITNFASKTTSIGRYDDLLGIYLNIDYVLKCIDATLSENPTNRSLRDFINKLLSGLEDTLGGVNSFDLHFDEEDSTYFIVDRKLTPDEDKLKGSKIELIGLNSTVENLSLTSKLTSSISTMMAISAQATSSDLSEDILSLQKWQQGLIDRHVKIKQVQTQNLSSLFQEKLKELEEKEEKIKVQEENWNTVRNIVSKMNTDVSATVMNYSNSELQAARPSFKKLMVKLLEFHTKKTKKNPAGLIPLELNLTIQGLGGIKIGQAFTVSEELLPQRYRGEVGFLITGLDHKIQSGRWKTEIKAQMIIISKYETDNVTIDVEQINKAFKVISTPPEPIETLVNWRKPLSQMKLRTGAGGLPHFGARRLKEDGTTDAHYGVDYQAKEGTPVYAPITGNLAPTGKFSKYGTVSVRIQGTGEYKGYGVQLGYVKLLGNLNIGNPVKAGQQVGVMQNMVQYYPTSPGMQNHLHFSVYIGNNTNDKIDPTNIKLN